MKKNNTLNLPYAARELIFLAGLEQLMKETGVTLGVATRDSMTLGVPTDAKPAKKKTSKVAK